MGRPGPRLPVAKPHEAAPRRDPPRRPLPPINIKGWERTNEPIPQPPPKPDPPPRPEPVAIKPPREVPCGECPCCLDLSKTLARAQGMAESLEIELASVVDSETLEDLLERHIRLMFKTVTPLKLGDSIETAVKYYAAKRKNEPAAPDPKWGSALGAANGGRL